MILGDSCTRRCRFCAVGTGLPGEVDRLEPLARGRGHRADGPEARPRHDGRPGRPARRRRRHDGRDGPRHPRPRCRTARSKSSLRISWAPRESIRTVVESGPDIVSHNLETVRRLTPLVRSRSSYDRSLDFLRVAKELDPEGVTKSSIMLGLGETRDEAISALDDLRAARVDIVNITPIPPAHAHQSPRREVLASRRVRRAQGARHGERLPPLRGGAAGPLLLPCGRAVRRLP